MLPVDKGIRDLLPFMQVDPENGAQLIAGFDGAPGGTNTLPAPPTPSDEAQIETDALADRSTSWDAPNANDFGMPEEHDGGGRSPSLIKAPSHSPGWPDGPPLPHGDVEHVHILSPNAASFLNVETLKPLSLLKSEGGGAPSQREIIQDGDKSDGAFNQGKDLAPVNPPSLGGDEDTGINNIKVSQTAEVDQNANIIVNGYAGKVVGRLHIDQDLLMEQDVDIELDFDGEGHFFVLLDQDMRIEQDIDIDVKIYDVDEVLYVEVFLKDRVSVEQNATLAAHVTDGPPGGSAAIEQDLEMDQDVNVNVDVEDELEERYAVKVDVDVQQDADADQDALVEITDRHGDIEVDVESYQIALIDQDTTVRVDFATV